MTTQTKSAPRKSPARSEVDPRDCWNLSGLYRDVETWEKEFAALSALVPALAAFKGRLGESARVLAEFLALDVETERMLRRLSTFASRRSDEDTSNSFWKGLTDRVTGLSTKIAEATSFTSPELMKIPDDRMKALMADPALAGFRVALEKILRYKPHTLGEAEERLLALSSDFSQAAYDAFSQLVNADLKFGFVVDEAGNEVEVTHAGYHSFLQKEDREVRKRFFEKYYDGFEAHKYTLASTLGSGLKKNYFYARTRNFRSTREAALFGNAIPESVYDNLIGTVRGHLDVLYRYYDLRRRALRLPDIHFYDIFVPIVSKVESSYPYEEAVDLVIDSLKPLGNEYVSTLRKGLLSGWVDRYENRGKRSGAYSSGCYDSDPYILLNYRADTLDSVYTLTHEAGHSMHTWHSKRQPPQYSSYSIFVAEVASTFNEALLSMALFDRTHDPRMRAYLVHREIDDMRSTLFRQTMFAEFEAEVHARAEKNEPLSLDDLTRTYHAILERYYGPGFTLDPQLDLECLRVPHFYYNFYVFQYATGLSAALALAEKVHARESGALERYLGFLSAGSSKFPIEILRDAGVDMESPAPVQAAMTRFGELVDELEGLLKEIGSLP